MLEHYTQFLDYVQSMGMIAFAGKFLEGFPKLQDLTAEERWHTGDSDTDPWQWKDRAAAEGKLAFGCVLGGAKGFIGRELYPLFYRACRPRYTVGERYSEGRATPTLRDVSRLFEEGRTLSTSEIRAAMNVTQKTGASRVDSAVATLQKEFYITVCGNRRKVNREGREYGWPANTYCRVEDWAGDWLEGAEAISREEARERLLDHCDSWGLGLDLEQLEPLLFGKRREW